MKFAYSIEFNVTVHDHFVVSPLRKAQMVVRPHLAVQYEGTANLLSSGLPMLKEVKSISSSGTWSSFLGVLF